MSGLSFEPATTDGVEAIGEWLWETAPELFTYLFGGRGEAIDILRQHWQLDSGMFTHKNAVFAKLAGEVVGLEHGFPTKSKEGLSQETGKQWYSDLDAAAFEALVSRAREVASLTAARPADSYYLQHLVVAPAARGTGCGRALLSRAFENAKADGLASLHLDVMNNNPAQGFYIANGMDDILEIRVPKLVREVNMPGCTRMVKEL